MAVLSQPDKDLVYAYFVGQLNVSGEGIATIKADLKAAITAADTWADTNAAAYNSALPVAARTTLTTRQKARLLEAVIRRRYEVS